MKENKYIKSIYESNKEAMEHIGIKKESKIAKNIINSTAKVIQDHEENSRSIKKVDIGQYTTMYFECPCCNEMSDIMDDQENEESLVCEHCLELVKVE